MKAYTQRTTKSYPPLHRISVTYNKTTFYRFLWIILLAIISQSSAHILRLECTIHANFSIEKPDEKLKSAFLVLHGIDKAECQYECSTNKRCKSLNINEKEAICELNDQSTEDRRDNAMTVAAAEWTYYSTSYNDTLVSRLLFAIYY